MEFFFGSDRAVVELAEEVRVACGSGVYMSRLRFGAELRSGVGLTFRLWMSGLVQRGGVVSSSRGHFVEEV